MISIFYSVTWEPQVRKTFPQWLLYFHVITYQYGLSQLMSSLLGSWTIPAIIDSCVCGWIWCVCMCVRVCVCEGNEWKMYTMHICSNTRYHVSRLLQWHLLLKVWWKITDCTSRRVVKVTSGCWTSVKGGTHTRFVDSVNIHASTKYVWAPPLMEVQRYGASSISKWSKYMTE